MVGEASGRMQKADCRDEIALPAAMLAWLKYRKQRTRNSRKRFLVFFCSLFVKARVVYRLRLTQREWCRIHGISIHTFEYRCRIVRQTMENLLSEKQPSVQFAELDVQPSVPETSGIRIQASGISVEFFPDADCNQIKTVMEVLCHAAK